MIKIEVLYQKNFVNLWKIWKGVEIVEIRNTVYLDFISR